VLHHNSGESTPRRQCRSKTRIYFLQQYRHSLLAVATNDLPSTGMSSHTGCLVNKRADEQAKLGRMAEGSAICPGPQKYGPFWLCVLPAVREIAERSGKTLPRDSAPNRCLLEKTASFNTLRAVRKRSTVFVTGLLHHKEGATVSRIIRQSTPAEYRIWLKYPLQTNLKRLGIAKSPICPHCSEALPESLMHFQVA
jgi:hypothetical protein